MKLIGCHIYYNNNFQETFGFTQVYNQVDDGVKQSQYAYLNWDNKPVFNIADYQHMVKLNIYSSNDENGVNSIRVMNENEEELIQLDTEAVFTEMLSQYDGNEMSVEEATITQENDKVKLSIVANSVDRYDDQYHAEIYMFVNIK